MRGEGVEGDRWASEVERHVEGVREAVGETVLAKGKRVDHAVGVLGVV